MKGLCVTRTEMGLRALSSNELLLALRNEVLYINVKENTVEEYEIPKEKADDEGAGVPGVQNIAVSPDLQYVALSTRDKYLYVFTLNKSPFQLQEVAKIIIARVSNRLRFSSDSKQLLIADKTGDCYLWKFLTNDGLAPICGHLSMVMDVLLTEDQSALITCDRDEKIRVTSYPDTHNILAYCMGHREYVGQVELLPHNNEWVVSISGDQTLRIWDPKEGKGLLNLPLMGAGINMACWKTADNTSTIACNIYQSNVLQIYEIQTNSTGDGLKMKSLKQADLPSHTTIKDIHHCDGNIFILSGNKTDDQSFMQLEKFEYNPEERTYKPAALNRFNEMLRQKLTAFDAEEERDDVAILFKKRVDNLSDYHERKKRRIEEKSK